MIENGIHRNFSELPSAPEVKEPVEDVQKRILEELDIESPEVVPYSAAYPPEEQEVQKTQAFKEWYHGPLNENGEPKIFWHIGGDYFNKFDPDLMYSGRGFLNLGAGFYVGDTKAELGIYRQIAKEKLPKDETKKLEIARLRERLEHVDRTAWAMRTKLYDERRQSAEAFAELMDEKERLHEDILNFVKEKPEYKKYCEYYSGDAPLSDLEKKYIKRLFDSTYRDFLALRKQFEELKKKVDSNSRASENNDKLNEVNIKDERLQQKLRAMIDSLMPPGVALRCYANVKNVLSFNEAAPDELVDKIMNALGAKGFDEQECKARFLASGRTGMDLYKAVTAAVENIELKHHSEVAYGEDSPTTKKVRNFFNETGLVDAHTYEAPANAAFAHGGKTLIVYDENDILISPFYET